MCVGHRACEGQSQEVSPRLSPAFAGSLLWGQKGCKRRGSRVSPSQHVSRPLRWSRGSWGSVGRRASVPGHSLSARYMDHLPRASQSSGRIDEETGVERYNWSRSLAGEPQRPVALPTVCRTRLAYVHTRPECSGPHRWDHRKHSVSCRYNCKSSSGRAKKVKGKG